jgi:hypothetical protein
MSRYSDLVDLICLVPDHTLKAQLLEAAERLKEEYDQERQSDD